MGPFSSVMVYVENLKDHLVLRTEKFWSHLDEQASEMPDQQ